MTDAIAFAKNVRDTAFRDFLRGDGYAFRNTPEALTALFHYDSAVAVLEALCGPEAHCGEVDPELFSTYSDLYKDRCGFRPRGHVTVSQVREYITNCKDSDLEDDTQADDWDRYWLDRDAEEARRDAEEDARWLANEQARVADYGFEAWQIQAGRLKTISEREILSY